MSEIVVEHNGSMPEAMRQAIASTVIEGHDPSDAFLADATLVAEGNMSVDDAIARVITRYS
jgi:Antitoxin VbhA